MAWWNLFRSTVVPTVQQAVASTQQQEGAAAADTPVPTNPATGTLSGQRKQQPGSADSVFAPSDFAQGNEALMALEEALYNGTPLPPEIRAQLHALRTPGYVTNNINIMGIRDDWMNQHQNWEQETDKQLYDDFVALNRWRADHAGNALSREFGDELQLLASFDPSGLSQLALGDTNPHGMLGLQLDPLAELTGTRPEEWAGGMRSIAGTLNPFVGAGLAFAPVAAYGADVEDQARQFAVSQGLRYVGGQAAPYIKAGVSATFDWIRQLGLTPEQVAALEQVVTEAAASGYEMTPEDLAQYMAEGGAAAPAPAPVPDQLGMMSGMQPSFSTPANIFGEGQPPFPASQMMRSTPAMTTFTGEGMLPVEVPTATLPLDFSTMGASALSSLSEPEAPVEEAPAEQPAQEQPAQEQPAAEPSAAENFISKQIQNQLQKALADMLGLGSEQPTDAPTRDEGETDEQYTEELLTYLELDPQTMADLGLQPGSPEYMNYILEQADLRIAELTEGMDLNAEDLSEQLRAKTQEELMALQRALYVRGQLEAMVGSGTVTDPTTGEDVEVIGEGMFNPGTAGYQAGLARDIGNITSLDQLQKLLTRGFDPYGMQRSQDARLEQAKRTEREEEELRRRRSRGMLGL